MKMTCSGPNNLNDKNGFSFDSFGVIRSIRIFKTMREVIFEGLKRYITPVEITASPDKKKRGKKKD